MKGHRLRASFFLAAILSSWAPPAAHAAFGFGDIVYDPNNTAQTINLLHQAQQEFDRLGAVLGVSTRQFDQLVQLTSAFGQAAGLGASFTPQQIQAIVQTVPGLSAASLAALFNTNGLLDAFLGVPLDRWTLAVEDPTAFFRSILVNPAISRIGASSGLSSPAIAYTQWYSARSPEDQANLAARAAVDFSRLLSSEWLEGGKQRRINLEGLAAANNQTSARSDQAQTLLAQVRAEAQLNSTSNSILLEEAAQGSEAAENTARALEAQSEILQTEGDSRRDADELRLDGPG